MASVAAAPLVSVVVIFLDAAPFLDEAVASVAAQRYPEWELLLVDDGSTDGSTALAQAHAARRPDRVRWLEHPGHRNLGKSASRNAGIRAARGAYVTFLDADDVFLPDKLARQSALLEARPEVGMVYGRTEYWHSWQSGPGRGRDAIGRLGVTPGVVFRPPDLLTRFLADAGTVPCVCSVLVRTALALAIGGFDESIQHLYEDQVFLAKVCLHAPVLADDAVGERYRQRADSSSSLAVATGAYHPWRPNAARKAFLDWLAAYLTAHGVDDAALWRALRREAWPYRHPFWGQVVVPVRYAASALKGLFARAEAWS